MLYVRPLRYLQRHHAFAPIACQIRHASKHANTGQTTNIAIPSKLQPTELTQDGARTLRTRQYGNRSLPMPPVMDPLTIEAKKRHKQPKPLGYKVQETAFQKELKMNVYAQALATPVRQCSFTNARLPSYFLLPLVTEIASDTSADEANSTSPGQAKARLIPTDLLAAEESTTARTPMRSYVLNKRDILEQLNAKRKWSTVVSERMRKWYALKKHKQQHSVNVHKEWEWDDGTAEQVLAKLRQNVIGKIASASQERVLFATSIEQQMEPDGQAVACILRMKAVEEDQQEAVEVVGRGAPVYDLTDMLGDAVAQLSVVTDPELAQATYVAVQRTADTMQLQLALLRLVGFLSRSSDVA